MYHVANENDAWLRDKKGQLQEQLPSWSNQNFQFCQRKDKLYVPTSLFMQFLFENTTKTIDSWRILC